MTEKRGVSFRDHTAERLDSAAGDKPLSPLVDRYCWLGLEANAMLAERGVHIDDHGERVEFLLDRLADGLDAWDG